MISEETNEKSRGFEDVIEEEDDVVEVEKIQGLKDQQKQYLKSISTENETAVQKPASAVSVEESEVEKEMKVLLQKAEQYASFLVSRHQQQNKKKKVKQAPSKRRGKYDEELAEEEQLLAEENDENGDNLPTILSKQPKILQGGELKDYQMIGLNWMISLYETGLNGILADDMGLGKTIQSISLVSFLKDFKKINGPHLVIAPKSTLGNWFNEFQKWLPCCRTIKLIATKDEREEIVQKYIANAKFDVCLTSFEGAKLCANYLKKIKFQYIIIDEAHKIKNDESQTSLILRSFKTNYKILLTGTPLQNNLHELWSLLNFLMPDLFSNCEIFDTWFSANNLSGKNNDENGTKNMEMISQLHKILKPFMMRRTKSEVMKTLPPKKEIHLYVGLTEVQLNIYKNLLSPKKSISDSGEDKKFYLNTLMQLRKVCNHPYLFEGVEEEGLPPLGEHIITKCGKMMVLDKLLQKLKNGKHQVLIFSQMTMILDILEDYCNFRQFNYCRIDGNTDMDDRDTQISEFVKEDSSKYIFLLSTRAGGLGINLATADTVILYDSDWNPQMDLQAMDRAHRIGQKNIVNVYRLISENTVEEKIIERQTVKLKWDQLIIQQGRLAQKNRVLSRDEMKDMIHFGASAIFKSKGGTYSDEDIDSLLTRGEQKTKDYNKQFDDKFKSAEQVGELSLSSINIYDFLSKTNDTDLEKAKDDKEMLDEMLARELASELRSRREKKTMNYNINAQFSHLMAVAPAPKTAKIIRLPEHQLYIDREKLQELLQKEEDYKCSNPRTKKGDSKPDEFEENGLSAKENKLKDELSSKGFPTWLKQDYNSFVQACERYGKTAYKEIAEHIKTKNEEEVRLYSQAFWERLDLLSEKEKILKNMERGELALKQRQGIIELLRERCSMYSNASEEFEFNSSVYNKSKSRFFTSENDKFLVYSNYLNGYGNWPIIIREIKQHPLFRFDHFFKSRSEYELNKRLQSLLKVLEKEKEFNQQVEAKKLKMQQEAEEKQRELALKKAADQAAQAAIEAAKPPKQQSVNSTTLTQSTLSGPASTSAANGSAATSTPVVTAPTPKAAAAPKSNKKPQSSEKSESGTSNAANAAGASEKSNGALKQNSLLNYAIRIEKKKEVQQEQTPIAITVNEESKQESVENGKTHEQSKEISIIASNKSKDEEVQFVNKQIIEDLTMDVEVSKDKVNGVTSTNGHGSDTKKVSQNGVIEMDEEEEDEFIIVRKPDHESNGQVQTTGVGAKLNGKRVQTESKKQPAVVKKVKTN